MLEQKVWERRQTLEEFAEYAETYAREHKEPGSIGLRHLQRLASGRGPKGQPLGPVKPATARLLESILGLSIDELLRPTNESPQDSDLNRQHVSAQPLHASPDFSAAFDWLDERASWPPGTAQTKVSARLAEVSTGELRDRNTRRRKVNRSQVARALSAYYAASEPDYGLYQVEGAGQKIVTSVLTSPDWLNLNCALNARNDRLTLTSLATHPDIELDNEGVEAAVQQLAETMATKIRLVDMPLYRLLDIKIDRDSIAGSVGVTRFVNYALTMDLLENELVDAIAADLPLRRGSLPLRDRYLPNLASVLNISARPCVGGTLALCAIARPFDPYRGARDYALLVQERSGHVVNAARRLAVIPKGFHQPDTDIRSDTQIGGTLRREMEEELFGRDEVDNTCGERRAAAPMHPQRLSNPMRWLMGNADQLRMESTGFGLNLVSGNFEFASIVVVDDEEFWTRYGGDIEANWESSGLRLYSSLDRELLTELISDEAWSNEGVFALCQGLRRLAELADERVNLPTMAATANGR
ncbi:transcriptional regulator [Kutzneria kofuensis]|uniref:Uncharacterized protein n=1 Tax=Kutzneria kofuensis TaxID=103725 RepID=A0A7W9KBX3_9PSEU|nr:transcriptional regulator [Kutzneria kofuensis]MBB5889677.1 hypothetical protein [Kutzneria kofuensis]